MVRQVAMEIDGINFYSGCGGFGVSYGNVDVECTYIHPYQLN